jgi:hypothetical protein
VRRRRNCCVTRAEQADTQAPKETLDLPAELTRREKRLTALNQARQVIETRAKEMAAAQVEPYQAKVAARQARADKEKATGNESGGKTPLAPTEGPQDKDQYNFTDPESRIMKAGIGQHFEQSYNAQAAVDEAMLIVGERVSDAPNDKQELPANVAAISPRGISGQWVLRCRSGRGSGAKIRRHGERRDRVCGGGENGAP